MGDGIPLAGFSAILGGVQPGGLVLLEGGLAPAKNHLARDWADAAAAAGRRVAMVATRPGADGDGGVRRVDATQWEDGHARPGEDLVVDSFSLLSLEAAPAEVALRVRRVREGCRRHGTAALLVVDEGQMGDAAVAACRHLADGVVQFREREDPEGPVRFVRVPKWLDGRPRDRNIYYDFDGQRILIDTRRRVN